MSQLIKQELDDWLDQVDYSYLNSSNYTPSEFALSFMNFIKLVNGEEGESNKTPPVHLKMMDKLTEGSDRIVNLCFRGSGKALSLDTKLPTPNGWTTIKELKEGDLIFGEDGKPTRVLVKSEIFNKPMYRLHLKDGRTLDVSEDHINVIIHRRSRRRKSDGKNETYYERRELTTKELLNVKLFSTRKSTKKTPTGKEAMVWIPMAKPIQLPEKDLPLDPYTLGLILGDGCIDKVTGFSRIVANEVDWNFYEKQIPYLLGTKTRDKRRPNVITRGILKLGKKIKALGLCQDAYSKFIPEEYFLGSFEQRLALLRGLIDTDGYVKGTQVEFSSVSKRLVDDVRRLVFSLGGTSTYKEKINAAGNTSYCLKVFISYNPSLLPRKASIWKNANVWKDKVVLESIEPIEQVPSQCIYVDNDSHTFLAGDFVVTHNTTIFMEYFTLYLAVFHEIPGFGPVDGMIYVSDSMENGAKSARKNIEFRYERSEFLKKYITKAKFTDAYLEFENIKGEKMGVKLFGATTGLRGTKIFGKRPVLCILDDLISDEASKSKTVMTLIKDTVYKGVNYALDPTRHKIIFNGTPFNKEDIIIEAVESGAWDVNVWPVCEHFPCTREEFQGAWSDRFTYDYIQDQYQTALKTGKLAAFYQELMLRISSDDERLVQDSEIRWYDRPELLKNKHNFNFYITTDFATSAKETADYSVISVWAYNANKDWFWVDGICEKQTMDKNIDALFKLVQQYHPQAVGVEITGQQGGFIPWLQREMMTRNIWFNFATTKGTPGIRPTTDKLTRFNLVVPWFKAGKIYFPEQMKASNIMGIFMQQIKLCTINGIKGHDDCVDTISMLGYLTPWEPNENASKIIVPTAGDMYLDEPEIEILTRDSYIV